MKKPLSIKEPGGLDRWWSVMDAYDAPVCVGIEDRATALEIVRCVNAHEALVGACRMVSAHPYFKCLTCEAAIKEALTLAKETT